MFLNGYSVSEEKNPSLVKQKVENLSKLFFAKSVQRLFCVSLQLSPFMILLLSGGLSST